MYDALNVLIAAGIIQKNAKSVKYISNPTYKADKEVRNEDLKELDEEVKRTSESIERKKKAVEELKLKKRSLKYLLKRNKQLCSVNPSRRQRKEVAIRFPFIMLATENTPENTVPYS